MHIQEIGLHERFIVVDDHGHYWSGPLPGWVSELRHAKVFSRREEAEKVVRILGQQVKDIEDGTRFVAQVIVTTASDRWVTIDELRATLERRISILNELETDIHVLDVTLDWSSLREKTDD
jgi:CO dehydrogenase/acetyl-CoA synthase beta subunit